MSDNFERAVRDALAKTREQTIHALPQLPEDLSPSWVSHNAERVAAELRAALLADSHDVCENSRDCIVCQKRIQPMSGICFSCHAASVATFTNEPA